MRRRLVSTAACACLLVGALALSGCSTAKPPTAAPTGQTTNGAAAVLSDVQQDLAGIDGASAQADTDISAAEAAQAQNDNP